MLRIVKTIIDPFVIGETQSCVLSRQNNGSIDPARLRESLEKAVALVSDQQGTPIPIGHRRDQSPLEFSSAR
jgi:hypothetical protein